MRFLALAVLVACAAHPQKRISPPAPGALALVETSSDLGGTPVGASPARVTVVVVLASWCKECAAEVAILDQLRRSHPAVRFLGISYAANEEYDHRGSPAALRAYAGKRPWLRVVIADDALYAALGGPPKIPAVYVFDQAGGLVATFDRRERAMPDANELVRLLAQLGA
ncbi:MAG: TlpA family protein disulfide reductase [Myxococcales bacterium]|nr:TlpA family protein disulfide reductase [Myxococcales bacterium]